MDTGHSCCSEASGPCSAGVDGWYPLINTIHNQTLSSTTPLESPPIYQQSPNTLLVALPNLVGEALYLIVDVSLLSHEVLDLGVGVHHGRVIAPAKLGTDAWQ